MILEVYNLKYTPWLISHFTSNDYSQEPVYIDTLEIDSTVLVNVKLNNIADINIDQTNSDFVVDEIIKKMNCILFNDNIIYETITHNTSIYFYITKKLFNPITFKLLNTLSSEDDILPLRYKTRLVDDTSVINIDNIITNNILYKDIVYYRNVKGADYDAFYFVRYSKLFAANVSDTVILDVNEIDNTKSNKN